MAKINCSGNDRKQLVRTISELLGIPSKYLGMPSMAYQIGNYIVDKEGTLEFNDCQDSVEVETLLNRLRDLGFEAIGENPADKVIPNRTQTAGGTTARNGELETLVIEFPLSGFDPGKLNNLRHMVETKTPLIKKALGVYDLPIKVLDDHIAFPWFRNVDTNNAAAYSQFIQKLCETALTKKRITAKVCTETDNEAFAMRVWLVGLGLVGPQYSVCRKLMGRGLSGNTAFRYGKNGELRIN